MLGVRLTHLPFYANGAFIHAFANQLMRHCRASSVDAVSAALSAKRISLINTLQVTGNLRSISERLFSLIDFAKTLILSCAELFSTFNNGS